MELARAKARRGYQYLEIERKTEERYWYLFGEIYAMAGESGAHGDQPRWLVVQPAQGDGLPRSHQGYQGPQRANPHGGGNHARLALVSRCCGHLRRARIPRRLARCGVERVIIEVLSERTEVFDRGEKFTRLQTWNPSLTDYVLVSQVRAQLEHYTRQTDGSWSYRLTTGLVASVAIESIRCSLKLADVYDRIEFDEAPGDTGVVD
jgi:hypothetical protein